MALRKLEYVARFYRELKRQNRLLSGRRLPPVLPIVVDNGRRVWRAPRRLSELIVDAPPELRRFQPEMEYLLVDELRLPAELGRSRDLLAAIAALEQSDSPAGVLSVVERLIDWLGSDEDSDLRRAFAAWLRLVLVPMKLDGEDQLPEVDNLMEMQTMLLENMQRWADNFKAETRREVRTSLEPEVRAEVQAKVRAEVQAEVRAEVQAEVRAEAQAQVRQREADFLATLIERKFGTLAAEQRQKLLDATPELREHWGLRLIDAPTLEDVFD